MQNAASIAAEIYGGRYDGMRLPMGLEMLGWSFIRCEAEFLDWLARENHQCQHRYAGGPVKIFFKRRYSPGVTPLVGIHEDAKRHPANR